jgi:thiamine biosynthesis protein ThiI
LNNNDIILVSYGEIALKGKYVRRKLERQLGEDIKNILKTHGFPEPEIILEFGRIYVNRVPFEAVSKIAKVFGVVRVMPATKTKPEFESIIDKILEAAKNLMDYGESFAIRAKVVGNHSYGSRDIAVEAGNRILEALKEKLIHVDLDNPDHIFYVEVRDKAAFIYSQIIQGAKGFPYGTQGKMVSLFSGGIDSPVSTWLMMKRGVHIFPLFMDQTPYVGKSYIDRAFSSFKAIAEYVPKKDFSFYSAPMGEVMERILEGENSRYNCVICKRSMYRIASYFAKKKKAKGIITGESLGQVASQTLDNLAVIDEAINTLLVRPIIGFDKVEIEEIARKIGTYKISAKTVNGCTSVPKNPVTRSDLTTIKKIEDKLNLEDLCYKTSEKITKFCYEKDS